MRTRTFVAVEFALAGAGTVVDQVLSVVPTWAVAAVTVFAMLYAAYSHYSQREKSPSPDASQEDPLRMASELFKMIETHSEVKIPFKLPSPVTLSRSIHWKEKLHKMGLSPEHAGLTEGNWTRRWADYLVVILPILEEHGIQRALETTRSMREHAGK